MSTGTVVLGVMSLASQLRTFLDSLASTEGRLAVSGAILLITIVVGGLVAPLVVRRATRLVRGLIPAGRASRVADRMGALIPTTAGGLVLRSTQIALLVFAVLSLLVVWGLVDLAVELLALLGLSIPVLVKLGATFLLAAIAYGVADVLAEALGRFSDGSARVTEHQQEIVLRAGNLGIIALFVSATLTVWGVDLSGLLVGAGFLGIVVGLAARQTLGSLIAGFVLMFSRPFTIGDWVEIGGDDGIVRDITIMNTRLQNFNGETIVIPNDRVNNQPITNRSNRGQYRVRLDVGVDYETDIDHAAEVAREVLTEIDRIASAPPPQIVPKSFADSAVVLELRFWIKNPMPPRKWRAIDAAVRGIKESFEEEDIKIPYPQREVSGREAGFRVHDSAKSPAKMQTEP